MSKLTKKDRIYHLEFQVAWLTDAVHELQGTENPEPQLKQLDQSVFDGLDEKWRFAAVDDDGRAYYFMKKPVIDQDDPCFIDGSTTRCKWIGDDYDASNWQNSLIESDTAKEILEVDLSSELTGSELCKAMLARGDKHVMCLVSDSSEHVAIQNEILGIVTGTNSKDLFTTSSINAWMYVVPINNQGEPLTASEAGL